MAWTGAGEKVKQVVRQGIVFWVRDHGACVLLPALPASAGGLSYMARGSAGIVGGGAVGTKGTGVSCQVTTDDQCQNIGNHGCEPADAGGAAAEAHTC